MEKVYELVNVDRIFFYFFCQKIEIIVSFYYVSVYLCLVLFLVLELLVFWEVGRMDVYFNIFGFYFRNKMVLGVSFFIEFVV